MNLSKILVLVALTIVPSLLQGCGYAMVHCGCSKYGKNGYERHYQGIASAPLTWSPELECSTGAAGHKACKCKFGNTSTCIGRAE